MIDKQRVKNALLAHAQAELTASTAATGDEQRETEIDQDSAYTVDAQFRADQASFVDAPLRDITAKQRALVDQIEQLDVAAAHEVGPGAVVEFDDQHYIVGVAVDDFECDGVDYAGIATDAPIYAAIAGLRAGDTFTFRDQQHRLDSVV